MRRTPRHESPGHAFREVTVSDAVVSYITSPACANAEARRRHFRVLSVLAEQIGMIRPLATVTAADVSDAVERLWGSVEPEVLRDRYTVIAHLLTWCRDIAHWDAPQSVDIQPVDVPNTVGTRLSGVRAGMQPRVAASRSRSLIMIYPKWQPGGRER